MDDMGVPYAQHALTGFAGLSAAKAYLQCAQDTNLVLLDTVWRMISF